MCNRRIRWSLAAAFFSSFLFVRASAALPTLPHAAPHKSRAVSAIDATLGISVTRSVVPTKLYAALAMYVPSFSRQTGLACSACHYQFPQLTPFGRLFKLNGYTLTSLSTIGQPGDSVGRETLKLASIPPLAAMVVTGLTQTARVQPATQNATISFPQELSLFVAGQITPHVGIFTQFTYAAADASIGIDNVDLRWAKHASLADRDVLVG
ncbi:MAG TPA: hypothetical protein VE110_03490, partial [Gemmatimonadaceae bacterium]|nr:hypothetical protein [Gemmatimonadaceae bacterium]